MGAFVDVSDIGPLHSIGVARVAQPPPGFKATEEELCTVTLPRPADAVVDLATGGRSLSLFSFSLSLFRLLARSLSLLPLSRSLSLSLSLVVPRCLSLSLVVSRCLSLSLVVSRCLSLSSFVSLCVSLFVSLSLSSPLSLHLSLSSSSHFFRVSLTSSLSLSSPRPPALSSLSLLVCPHPLSPPQPQLHPRVCLHVVVEESRHVVMSQSMTWRARLGG